MGLKDKFAESFARSKTMTGPERKANEIMGKILLKKSILPIVLMLIVVFAGAMYDLQWYITLGVNLVIAACAYFYIKKSGDKLQNFKPYVGTLINVEKKGKNDYVAIIKQGKLPVKLEIAHGGEDLMNIRKNQLVQISYNPDQKVAIVVTK